MMSQIFEWARRIKMELELYERQDLELADARMGLPEGERDQDREREEDRSIDLRRKGRLAEMFQKGLGRMASGGVPSQLKIGRIPIWAREHRCGAQYEITQYGGTHWIALVGNEHMPPEEAEAWAKRFAGAHTPDCKPGVQE